MPRTAPSIPQPPPAGGAETARNDWIAKMGQIGQDDGFLTSLGPSHWAMFAQENGRLLVTFDTVQSALARPDQLPNLYDFASTMGWSYLCILANGNTWFRDPAVYAFMDQMVGEGFFDSFDSVVFYGAGMAGYAAASFSAVAPACSVLAIAPRATMTPARVPFETRDPQTRRMDFTSRYGFAPDMVRGARDVWIIRDPLHMPDAAQAALFQGRNVQTLNLRYMGERTESALTELDILPKLLAALMKSEMSPGLLASLWRARRKFGGYLKLLMARCEAAGKETRSYAICANVARRTNAPRFRRRKEEMDAARLAAAKGTKVTP